MREYKPLYKREESFSAPSKSLGRKGVWRNNNWRGYLSLTLIVVGIGYALYSHQSEPYTSPGVRAIEERIAKRNAIDKNDLYIVQMDIGMRMSKGLDTDAAYRKTLGDYRLAIKRAGTLKGNAGTEREYDKYCTEESDFLRFMEVLRFMAKDRKIKLE